MRFTSCIHLLESLLGKVRENEAGSVDFGVVVAAVLVLLLLSPTAERGLDVAAGVLAADHEADLTRGVGGDGSVGVFSDGEDFLAVGLELGDEGEVKPLVLGCRLIVSTGAPKKNIKQRYDAERTVIINFKHATQDYRKLSWESSSCFGQSLGWKGTV